MLLWNSLGMNRYIELPCVFLMFIIILGWSISVQASNQQANPTTSTQHQQQETTVPQGPGVLEFYRDRSVGSDEKDPERLSDEPIAYPAFKVKRLRPLLEIGNPFLGNGPIRPGIKTPSGQMLQPWFLLFGSFRSAVQSYYDGNQKSTEWSNRIDLHGNLNLSGTERLLVSMRSLDQDNGKYTGFNLEPGVDDGWQNGFNGKLTQFFFEGELGEIFPDLDPSDSGTLDWGFSIGRQPVSIQDGQLINDTIDLIGITRNSLISSSISNMRITGIYGWNSINRGSEANDDSAQLYGVFSESDTGWGSTVSVDVVHVDAKDSSDAWYLGVGSTQRIGSINTTFRINSSIPEHANTPSASHGTLLFAELSRTLHGSDNILYLNTFWNIDNFTSAARSREEGTPLANLGILYGPVGMGRYGVPLGQPIANTIGTALGYQLFFNGIRRQLIFEIGIRESTKGESDEGALGFGTRYQQAIGKRFLLRFDSFVATHEKKGRSYGMRLEWMTKF